MLTAVEHADDPAQELEQQFALRIAAALPGQRKFDFKSGSIRQGQ